MGIAAEFQHMWEDQEINALAGQRQVRWVSAQLACIGLHVNAMRNAAGGEEIGNMHPHLQGVETEDIGNRVVEPALLSLKQMRAQFGLKPIACYTQNHIPPRSFFMRVVPIPAFEDNYIWAIHDDAQCVLVDPGDAEPVFEWLTQTRLYPVAVLVTHHHGDHVGGIAGLQVSFDGLSVYGPELEPINGLTHRLGHGDMVNLAGLNLDLEVIGVPGHTRGHIAYYGAGMLFCGDTLFSCGCGRLFEGTSEQMFASLNRLASLPPDTRVYCAHEYTLANIRFALAVEPCNADLIAWGIEAQRLRRGKLPTIPTTIAHELRTNPFLRCDQTRVIASAEEHAGRSLLSALSVFAALRDWKNRF
jgi:hydroxyacylglutathione hydrolase